MREPMTDYLLPITRFYLYLSFLGIGMTSRFHS
jgi:hypothetical protein